MFFLIFCILNLIVATTCSIVFDKTNQNGIYVRDYCPKMEHCPEGTHVLCMYHDSVNVMGPRCNNGQNLTMTEQFKNLLLDWINEIRSTAAKGTEVGKDGQLLPKAYGMFRLEWDKELATFAQVWANQCTLNHDLCRATKKFPNPSQVAGVIRFRYPDWQFTGEVPPDAPVENNLSEYKLEYALRRTVMNSYERKDLVTRDMILHYPDMIAQKELFKARVYLAMIHGFSTHIGCGISSYVTYHGYGSTPVIYNAVELVCNFSGQPEEGKKVFETDPPQKEGWTITCGCPPGFDEDNDCLCVKSESPPTEKPCTQGDGICEPAVVLLPIFTVEDAPPEKLFHASSGNISAFRRDNSFEIFNIVHPQGNHLFPTVKPSFLMPSSSVIASPPRINMSPPRINMSPPRINMSPSQLNMSPPRIELPQSRLSMAPSQLNKRIGKIDNKRFKGVKKRYFNKKAIIPEKRYQAGVSPERRAGHVQQNRIPPFVKKDSIFTRATKFQLPAQNNDRTLSTNNSLRWKSNAIKKDVTPRKDFSRVQGLMSAYLNKKYGDNAKKPIGLVVTTNKYEEHVEHLLASVVQRQQKFGIQNFNSTALFKKFDIKNSNEETDTKLLSLLDNLEQEVRHIDLKKNVKEIFDAKIRKIYGNVLGDPDLLSNTPLEVVDELLAKIEKKTNSPLYEENDHRINIDPPTHNFDPGRPLKRSQNSIVQYDKPNYDHYRSKYSIFNKNDRDTSYGVDPGKDDVQRDVKTDNSFKDSRYYDNYANGQEKYKNMDRIKMRNYYLNDEEDPLGLERRKYYQEKLDKLERRLQNVRGGYRRQNEIKDNSRPVRPVLNPRKDLEQRPVNHPQNFYLPDRAKFLHGF